ncbi:hypothetical protein NC653_014504 [Populus alba x Populus x berolinensis]|nr:hypothetical protein NC653_014504 [Populus alba x Populus x berolinensis]
MGCLPLERSTNFMHPNSCVKEYNDLASQFNGKLDQSVAKLNGELPGMKVLFSNPYDLLLQIITAPSLYGKFDLLFITLHTSKIQNIRIILNFNKICF